MLHPVFRIADLANVTHCCAKIVQETREEWGGQQSMNKVRFPGEEMGGGGKLSPSLISLNYPPPIPRAGGPCPKEKRGRNTNKRRDAKKGGNRSAHIPHFWGKGGVLNGPKLEGA